MSLVITLHFLAIYARLMQCSTWVINMGCHQFEILPPFFEMMTELAFTPVITLDCFPLYHY